MLIYHIRSMGMNDKNPSPIFLDNPSMVLNSNNPGISLNNKTVALSYHFVRKNVANDVVEVHNIDTK